MVPSLSPVLSCFITMMDEVKTF